MFTSPMSRLMSASMFVTKQDKEAQIDRVKDAP